MDPPLGYESDAEDSFSEYKRSVRGNNLSQLDLKIQAPNRSVDLS